MKKILYFLAVGLMLLSVGCQDQLEKDFNNPEQYEAPKDKLASGLFSSTLYSWKVYVQDYGETWWAQPLWSYIGYSQLATIPLPRYDYWFEYWEDVKTGNGFSGDNQLRGYFNDMYTKMKGWSLLKSLMEKDFSDADKQENMVYYQLLTVMKEFTMLRNVDIFNSIPYSEAIQGNEGVLVAKYDDPLEIYKTAITNLMDIASTLVDNYNKMSAEGKELFTNQDIALHGDIQMWKQYVNALILKNAIRMSHADLDFSKKAIAAAISGGLPTKDMMWQLPTNVAKDLPGGGTIVRGWYETAYFYYMPNVILERMNHNGPEYTPGVDDPRLPVLATPTRYNDYRGIRMNNDFEAQQAAPITNRPDSEKPANVSDADWKLQKTWAFMGGSSVAVGDLSRYKYNCVSMYNPATYWFANFPAYMMSLAEVDLLLAEVEAKGLGSTGSSAAQHIADAVTHSTDFWYTLNSYTICDKAKYPAYMPNKPAAADVATYANWLKNEYSKLTTVDDKMEMIMQQKYIHLNIMCALECWTELRRTRHPLLEPVSISPFFQNSKTCAERMRYPDSEQSTNTDNYQMVKDQDNYTTPIFWTESTTPYYRNDYIPVEYTPVGGN
jgi:hypothetical protein